MARSFQEWVHWIELGSGAAWIRRLSAALGLVLLSLLVCYKQFEGPKSETTLSQAVVGRQIARGQGYTTLVNYPQTAARLQEQGTPWGREAFPELYSAPLYPATIGALFAVMPDWFEKALFDIDPEPPNGFAPDYVLLALNVVLFWLAAVQIYLVGRELFDRTVGLISCLAWVCSAPLWRDVVAVNGMSLSAVVFLALLHSCIAIERGSVRGTLPMGALFLGGAACGGLFLTDYHAGFVVVPLLVFVWIVYAGQRVGALLPVLLGFLLLVCGWGTWNAIRTGSPVGLAWQEIAMSADRSIADPNHVRASLSTTSPVLTLAKLGNKGLTALQQTIQERLWSGGAMLFAGFFVAGLLYRFRQQRLNVLRIVCISFVGVLTLAHAFLTAGLSERHPLAYASPVLIVFGVGFCAVLIASSERWADYAKWCFGLLLAVHALPLARDVVEPRRLHFSFPPYYPSLFLGMRDEMVLRGGDNPGWMADVPAGAAWYSGQRVWAQPATLRDFYAIGAEQPMLALVLTPHTLDRSYFGQLSRRTEASRLGDWADIYAGIALDRLPAGFPLSQPQKVADNLIVLIDPLAQPLRRR